jgi:hypothetical protein
VPRSPRHLGQSVGIDFSDSCSPNVPLIYAQSFRAQRICLYLVSCETEPVAGSGKTLPRNVWTVASSQT